MSCKRPNDRLDYNCAFLQAAEPYFAERYRLARALLESATIGNGGIIYPGGHTCGAYGCSCQDFAGGVECVHAVAYRIYTGRTFHETRYEAP